MTNEGAVSANMHDVAAHEQPESSASGERRGAVPRSSPQASTEHMGNVPPARQSAAPKPNSFKKIIGSVNNNWETGARFAEDLITLPGKGLTDQQQAESIHYMAHHVPPVTEHGLARTLRGTRQALDTLHRGGTEIAVVTDLHSHEGFGELRAHVEKFNPGMQLLDVPQIAMQRVADRAPDAYNVGLLVPGHVYEARVFQRYGKDKHWVQAQGDTSHLDAAEHRDATPGEIAAGREQLRAAVQHMAEHSNVDAIVVGYPAISSALEMDHVMVGERRIPIIDSNKEAASRALHLSNADHTDHAEDMQFGCAGCLPFLQKLSMDHFDHAIAKLRAKPVERHDPQVGAMGGMGALAGAQFVRIYGKNAKGEMVLHQATHVPDRTSWIKKRNGDPAMADAHDPQPEMQKSVDRMHAMGITRFSKICNTAHDEYANTTAYIQEKGYDMHIEHIAGAAVQDIQQVPGANHVVLLATDGTVAQGLYQNHANNRLSWVTPDPEHQAMTMSVIYQGVKVGDMELARTKLAMVIDHQLAQHNDAHPGEPAVFVMGCTELPLPFDETELRQRWPGVTFVDPMSSAARRLFSAGDSPVALTPENVRIGAALLARAHPDIQDREAA
ncbi:MAG TPA: aspartate/glutamate racemase family protein [Paraburkholderia sp.]|nr:aspartate/glutamate racemase family protein [Paraburkholderia sp.]